MHKSLLSFVLISLTTSSVYANDAVILLNQMNDALHTLEYQGKLIYLKNGEVSNLSIRHTMENGAEKEVIASLDESGDEYIRESNAFSLSGLPKITPQMQDVYSFDLGGMGKVAGRPCRIVLARPKDRKRYLQKYCIDLDRSVLLKYSLINQHHEPVERFMFTDFQILSTRKIVAETRESEPSDVLSFSNAKRSSATKMQEMSNSLMPNPALSAERTEKDGVISQIENNDMESSIALNASKINSSPDQYSDWFFDSLPAGFNIVSADKEKNPESEDEQIIISDGLSSVSVFISSDKNIAKQYKPIQSGALNILTKVYQGHAVTLVGEVPEATLHDIFKGIKKATIDK